MSAVIIAPSKAEVLSWGTTIDLASAARAFGINVAAARRAFHDGELPFTAIRVGQHKIRAVTATVWEALGIAPDEA